MDSDLFDVVGGTQAEQMAIKVMDVAVLLPVCSRCQLNVDEPVRKRAFEGVLVNLEDHHVLNLQMDFCPRVVVVVVVVVFVFSFSGKGGEGRSLSYLTMIGFVVIIVVVRYFHHYHSHQHSHFHHQAVV